MDVRLASFNPTLKRVETASQEAAPVFGYLLTPVALVGYVLAVWRLAADMRWVSDFFVETGLFSHWQVWLALAVAIHMLASYLNRVARQDHTVLS